MALNDDLQTLGIDPETATGKDRHIVQALRARYRGADLSGRPDLLGLLAEVDEALKDAPVKKDFAGRLKNLRADLKLIRQGGTENEQTFAAALLLILRLLARQARIEDGESE